MLQNGCSSSCRAAAVFPLESHTPAQYQKGQVLPLTMARSSFCCFSLASFSCSRRCLANSGSSICSEMVSAHPTHISLPMYRDTLSGPSAARAAFHREWQQIGLRRGPRAGLASGAVGRPLVAVPGAPPGPRHGTAASGAATCSRQLSCCSLGLAGRGGEPTEQSHFTLTIRNYSPTTKLCSAIADSTAIAEFASHLEKPLGAVPCSK